MNTIPEGMKSRKAVVAGKSPSKWAGMGPVFLSAVVFPGVGQLVQRRWVAGAGYALLFGAVFGWMMIRCFGVLKLYYDFAFDFNRATGDVPSLGAIGWPFLFSAVVYLASLIDTVLGNRLPKPKKNQGTPADACVP